MSCIENKDVDELCDFIKDSIPDIKCDVLENFKRHKVNGEIFAQLDEEYLRELAPLLGDRVRLKKIISAAFEPASVTQTPESTPVTSPPTQYSPTPSVHSSQTYEVMLL